MAFNSLATAGAVVVDRGCNFDIAQNTTPGYRAVQPTPLCPYGSISTSNEYKDKLWLWVN